MDSPALGCEVLRSQNQKFLLGTRSDTMPDITPDSSARKGYVTDVRKLDLHGQMQLTAVGLQDTKVPLHTLSSRRGYPPALNHVTRCSHITARPARRVLQRLL